MSMENYKWDSQLNFLILQECQCLGLENYKLCK